MDPTGSRYGTARSPKELVSLTSFFPSVLAGISVLVSLSVYELLNDNMPLGTIDNLDTTYLRACARAHTQERAGEMDPTDAPTLSSPRR